MRRLLHYVIASQTKLSHVIRRKTLSYTSLDRLLGIK
nr:MAG TPA: hypothetical protein [Caudoviricetes sp.]